MQTDPTATSPRFLGKYEVLARLDSGGMAEIFLARSRGMAGFEKIVVLKRILPHLAAEEEFVSLFLDEAKTTVSLSHGNIVQVFDMGRGDDAADYFIAMEYVPGKNLRRLIRRHHEKKGPHFDVALAIWLTGEILKGLDYAHRKSDAAGRPLGIVHRDLSPHNILISYEGEVKVADFGIAKAASKVVHTETGLIRGKASYMSPEQAQADPLDNRSDLFAVGILLYEMLTGLPPWPGEQPQLVLRALTTGPMPEPPSKKRADVDEELDRIVFKTLARNPEDRYATADRIQHDLGMWLAERSKVLGQRHVALTMQELFADEMKAEQEQIAALTRPASLTATTRVLPHEPAPGEKVATPTGAVPTLRFQTPKKPGTPASRAVAAVKTAPRYAVVAVLLGAVALAIGGWMVHRANVETAGHATPAPSFTAIVDRTPVPTATAAPIASAEPSSVAVVATHRPHPATPAPTSPPAQAADGFLTVNANPWGYVFVDDAPVTGLPETIDVAGRRLTPTPILAHPLPMRPGKHRVRVVQFDAGGNVALSGETIVDVAPGGTAAITIPMK